MTARVLSSKIFVVCPFHSSQLFKNLSHKNHSITHLKGKTISSQTKLSNTPAILHRLSCHHRYNSNLILKTMQVAQMDQTSEKHTLAVEKVFTPITNVGESDGWLNIGLYSVFAWSISGVESCIIVKSDDMQVVFDLGIAPKESVKVPNVFITHGHVDHVGSLINHISKRLLFNMKPARYFVHPHLVEPIQQVIAAHNQMAEVTDSPPEVNIIPVGPSETIKLNSSFFVKPFPTKHRVASQGYILYKQTKTLKQEYKGLDGFEVAGLHRKGTDIHDIITTPEIAYTGDTLIDVFLDPPTPDLLQVKLLITEATFLDENNKNASGMSKVEKARSRGHIHLTEIAQNSHLFDAVGHILLVHFSSKYSPKYICDCLRDKLPSELRAKVTPATVAFATRPTSYL